MSCPWLDQYLPYMSCFESLYFFKLPDNIATDLCQACEDWDRSSGFDFLIPHKHTFSKAIITSPHWRQDAWRPFPLEPRMFIYSHLLTPGDCCAYVAAKRGHLPLISHLMDQYGIRADFALAGAAAAGRSDLVYWLLRRKPQRLGPAVSAACLFDHVDLVKLLLGRYHITDRLGGWTVATGHCQSETLARELVILMPKPFSWDNFGFRFFPLLPIEVLYVYWQHTTTLEGWVCIEVAVHPSVTIKWLKAFFDRFDEGSRARFISLCLCSVASRKDASGRYVLSPSNVNRWMLRHSTPEQLAEWLPSSSADYPHIVPLFLEMGARYADFGPVVKAVVKQGIRYYKLLKISATCMVRGLLARKIGLNVARFVVCPYISGVNAHYQDMRYQPDEHVEVDDDTTSSDSW
jgi:hypothetical protein